MLERIVEADRRSVDRLGHGNAMAQAYITLFCRFATTVIYGPKSNGDWTISCRFGRPAEGMVAETACDDRVMRAGRAGVLSSSRAHQAKAVRKAGSGEQSWAAVDESSLVSSRLPLARSVGGETLAVFSMMAGSLKALLSTDCLPQWRPHRALQAGADNADDPDGVLIHAATDGEATVITFGGERCGLCVDACG